ncbi:EmrB/QacA subfamily drug resistance transporter [Actinomadura luteofluorescens]|uniref:EmrB/QacA subfamily drug resistance transporter n=1 Tax=Actinomadura luteofluorescens TaxID=46163 RepID=A0A7Y9EPN1_9ACTN|nr:MFS transporter [Actinomadura luteofluorescens]NYD50840.1 EmrB/QacA subfamily drug resistance transporter [Actinomadura luteofluorescens]
MTATLETPAPVAGTRPADGAPRRWLGLSAILAATLLNLLDSTVVNVAAPAIRADLGGSFSALQWTAAGYTLALAVALLTGGRLGDMFGRRPVLLAGAAAFTAMSAACAFAWSPESLIAARVAQGLCAAVMIPQGFGLIRDLFGAHTGKAFALFGPVIGLATILGPVVAGLLIDADLFGTGWRAIFLVNVPVGAYALIVGARALPAPSAADRSGGLDVSGMLLGGLGMSMLVYPLVQGRELGWPAWSLALLAGSFPVLALFALHQLRRARRGRTPLVRLSVFAGRAYSSGVLFVVVFFGAIAGFSLATGLFLQLGLGYTPLAASLAMSSWAAGAFAGSAFSGMTMARLGRRILHLGLLLMLAGLAALYAVFEAAGTGVGGWHLAAPLLLFGAGMGMIFVPLFDVIVADIADHEVGSGSAALESVQQLGASLGIAVLGTVFFGAVGAPVAGRFAAPAALEAAEQVTVLTAGLTAAAFLVAFLLPRRARAH